MQHERKHSDIQNVLQNPLSTVKPVLTFAEPNHEQEKISQPSDNLVCKENVPNRCHVMLSKWNCKNKGIYTCSTCKKQFKYKKALEEHESTHTGEKPYKCDKCSRSFGFHRSFVRHALTHEKPSFECEICNKKLRTKENLKKHKLSKHSNSFKCEICDKKLSTKLTLQNHYLTHTGEKPFTCDICNKGFAQKSLLMHHERKHTDIQNVPHNPLSTMKPVLTFAESNHQQEKISKSSDNLVCKENVPNLSTIMFSKQNCKGK
ncbi:Zinc finger protein 227, partial [Araneus ventricosus]